MNVLTPSQEIIKITPRQSSVTLKHVPSLENVLPLCKNAPQDPSKEDTVIDTCPSHLSRTESTQALCRDPDANSSPSNARILLDKSAEPVQVEDLIPLEHPTRAENDALQGNPMVYRTSLMREKIHQRFLQMQTDNTLPVFTVSEQQPEVHFRATTNIIEEQTHHYNQIWAVEKPDVLGSNEQEITQEKIKPDHITEESGSIQVKDHEWRAKQHNCSYLTRQIINPFTGKIFEIFPSSRYSSIDTYNMFRFTRPQPELDCSSIAEVDFECKSSSKSNNKNQSCKLNESPCKDPITKFVDWYDSVTDSQHENINPKMTRSSSIRSMLTSTTIDVSDLADPITMFKDPYHPGNEDSDHYSTILGPISLQSIDHVEVGEAVLALLLEVELKPARTTPDHTKPPLNVSLQTTDQKNKEDLQSLEDVSNSLVCSSLLEFDSSKESLERIGTSSNL